MDPQIVADTDTGTFDLIRSSLRLGDVRFALSAPAPGTNLNDDNLILSLVKLDQPASQTGDCVLKMHFLDDQIRMIMTLGFPE